MLVIPMFMDFKVLLHQELEDMEYLTTEQLRTTLEETLV